MSELFNSLDKISQSRNEYNDCTVKAWAIVCGISYDEAHQDWKEVGRKNRRGVTITKEMWDALCAKRGKTILSVYDFKAKTICSLEKELPKYGKFLIRVRGHILAATGGEIHDWTKGRRHRIKAIGRVV